MPLDTRQRICIVGAGAAGLAAAWALRELGYRQVVVLEKADRVGGKCWTRTADGTPLDAGAVFVLSHYPTVRYFARRAGVHFDRAIPMRYLAADGTERPFGCPPRPYPLRKRLLEFMRLGMEMGRSIGLYRRPLGEVEQAVIDRHALPYAEWIRRNGFGFFHQTAYPMLESWGYGHAEHEVPALYTFASIPNYAPNRNVLLMWDIRRIPIYQIREGFGEMWRRIAEPMDVRLNAEVMAIERDGKGGLVRTAGEIVPFDRLILACPPSALLDRMDATEEERDVFGRIRFLEVWQAALRTEGLPDSGIVERNLCHERMGRVTGFFRYRPGTDWYYFFGYTGGHDDAGILRFLEAEVRAMGGRVRGRPEPPVRWAYFPHYGSADLRAGYLGRQARLQGRNGTYYTGEYTAPIGVEYAAQQSLRLVRRYFA